MTAACLLDTNILLRLANTVAPEHRAAKAAVARLLSGDDRPVVAAQVLFELWSVATRPIAANGLGWSVARARAEVDAGLRPETPPPGSAPAASRLSRSQSAIPWRTSSWR